MNDEIDKNVEKAESVTEVTEKAKEVNPKRKLEVLEEMLEKGNEEKNTKESYFSRIRVIP